MKNQTVLLVLLSTVLAIGPGLRGTSAHEEATGTRISISQLRQIPVGLLDKMLGTRTVVEGMRAEKAKIANPLMVTKVDGRALSKTVILELREFELKPGEHYKFEGYESGAFEGPPSWLSPQIAQPFQY